MENLRKQCLVEEQWLVAVPERLDALHEALARFWRACDASNSAMQPAQWRYAFDIAVVEIGTNIMRHAYANLKPALLHVRLRVRPRCVTCCFVDSGQIYMPERMAAAASSAGNWMFLPEGGMGLGIAHKALDCLKYRRLHQRNFWFLAKSLPL